MANKRTFSFSPQVSRRQFVGGAAAVAGAAGLAGVLPERLAEAATVSPKDFNLSQVKHIVILMQENRSFDHYFGAFPGARGFKDPTVARQSNGRTVFQQDDPANPDGYLEPWHMSTFTSGAAAVPSLSHDWRDQHAAWNWGRNDRWLYTHLASDSDANGSFTMGHYEEADIPFHWALAKAFTLADNYHCAVLGPTDPNRLVWMNGNNDPQGLYGGPCLETSTPNPLTFISGAETLWNAGYTVKSYADVGYCTWAWFKNFINKDVPGALYNLALASGTLYGDGTPGGIGDPTSPTMAADANLNFEEDCANGVLPDVSYIYPPGSYYPTGDSSEHPPAIPATGAQMIASKLEALAANEDLWNSTVFIINYDENDGFFDHVIPPTPDPEKYPEEFVHVPSPKGTPGGGLPVGAGFRVPSFVVSPWSVGGHIFSEVSDHTSTLRFIEGVAAAGGLSGKGPVTFTPISRWRRATFSDYTGALNNTAAQAAPSNTQFDASTRSSFAASQSTASKQAMPERPGAEQDFPYPSSAAVPGSNVD
jgi:phospholipase C